MIQEKFWSRKLLVTGIMFLIFLICPLWISNKDILHTVFLYVTICGLSYCGVNVLSLFASISKGIIPNGNNNSSSIASNIGNSNSNSNNAGDSNDGSVAKSKSKKK